MGLTKRQAIMLGFLCVLIGLVLILAKNISFEKKMNPVFSPETGYGYGYGNDSSETGPGHGNANPSVSPETGPKPAPILAQCGDTTYDPAKQICCVKDGKGSVADSSGGACCGSANSQVAYNSKTQTCCKNWLGEGFVGGESSGLSCCGKNSVKVYDPKSQKCCQDSDNNGYVGGSAGMSCCGTGKSAVDFYDPATQVCCLQDEGSLGGVIGPKGSSCCGTSSPVNVFDPKTQTCCVGAFKTGDVSSPAGLSCCGSLYKKGYSESTSLCCGDQIVSKPSSGTPCCTFRDCPAPSKNACANGKVTTTCESYACKYACTS